MITSISFIRLQLQLSLSLSLLLSSLLIVTFIITIIIIIIVISIQLSFIHSWLHSSSAGLRREHDAPISRRSVLKGRSNVHQGTNYNESKQIRAYLRQRQNKKGQGDGSKCGDVYSTYICLQNSTHIYIYIHTYIHTVQYSTYIYMCVQSTVHIMCVQYT